MDISPIATVVLSRWMTRRTVVGEAALETLHSKGNAQITGFRDILSKSTRQQ
jgi:hypothetical protein